SVPLQAGFAEGETVVEMEVDEPPRLGVEGEVVLDPGVPESGRRRESLETAVEQDPGEDRSRPALDEEVEVRRSRERRPQVLVALPVTVGDPGGVELGEQRGDDTERRVVPGVIRSASRRYGSPGFHLHGSLPSAGGSAGAAGQRVLATCR